MASPKRRTVRASSKKRMSPKKRSIKRKSIRKSTRKSTRKVSRKCPCCGLVRCTCPKSCKACKQWRKSPKRKSSKRKSPKRKSSKRRTRK